MDTSCHTFANRGGSGSAIYRRRSIDVYTTTNCKGAGALRFEAHASKGNERCQRVDVSPASFAKVEARTGEANTPALSGTVLSEHEEWIQLNEHVDHFSEGMNEIQPTIDGRFAPTNGAALVQLTAYLRLTLPESYRRARCM